MFSDLTDNSRNRGRLDAYFGRSAAQTAKLQPPAARCSPQLSARSPQTVQSAADELPDAAAGPAVQRAVEAMQLPPSLHGTAIGLTAPKGCGVPDSSAPPQLRQRGPDAAGSAGDTALDCRRSPVAEDGGGVGPEALSALSEGSPCCTPRSPTDAPDQAPAAKVTQPTGGGAPGQPFLSPDIAEARGCLNQGGLCQLAMAACTSPEATSPSSTLKPATAAADEARVDDCREPQSASPAGQLSGSRLRSASWRSIGRSRSDTAGRLLPASPPAAEPSASGTAGGGAAGSTRAMDEDTAALALDGVCPREQQVTAEKRSPCARWVDLAVFVIRTGLSALPGLLAMNTSLTCWCTRCTPFYRCV